MTGQMDETPDDSSSDKLPAKTSITDHHEAVKEAGDHPVIGLDVEYDDIANGLDNGIHVSDGDRLIGIMERNECHICGRYGTLSMPESFGSARWVASNTKDGYNWTLKELSEDGYRPIVCGDRESPRYYNYIVGAASPEAVEDYWDWESQRDDIQSFQRTALKLAKYPEKLSSSSIHDHKPTRIIDVPLDGDYSHGHLLAAIYHCLGCSGYDPRNLMERSHVTKKQLAVILTRLWSLDVRPSRELSAGDWVNIERLGNNHGHVQWKIPSWAGTEELTATSRYKRGTYQGVMVEDEYLNYETE